jgi:hypothetical protein
MVHRKDCRWLSATNADNIYGTEVIERVRNVVNFPEIYKDKFHYYQKVPDMVLVPLDSRNWAEIGKFYFNFFIVLSKILLTICFFPCIDYMERQSKNYWDNNCDTIVSQLTLNALVMTVQPRPIVGRVDLAAVFFSRPKFLAENLFFGNFTNARKYPCKGCQDGYLTEYLVNSRFWTYRRLPVDGMKSAVFHGPSPSWCIAAGHVWFDHPDVGKVRCYSQRTADTLRLIDVPPRTVFDWVHFDKRSRVCLRFTAYGFSRAKKVRHNYVGRQSGNSTTTTEVVVSSRKEREANEYV